MHKIRPKNLTETVYSSRSFRVYIQLLGLGFGALSLNRPDCGQRRYRGKAEAVFHRTPRSVTQLLWVETTRCGRIWYFEERQESDGLEGSSEGVQAMENSTR